MADSVVKIKLSQLPLYIIPEEFRGYAATLNTQNNYALEELNRVRSTLGALLHPILLIDGRPGTIANAKVGSRYVWADAIQEKGRSTRIKKVEYPYFNEALRMAYAEALRLVPEYTGQARNAFVWVSGRGEIQTAIPQKTKWSYGETWFLVNKAPYMRKIEELKHKPPKQRFTKTGKLKKMSKMTIKQGFNRYSVQAPNGVFRVISKRVRAKFRMYFAARMMLLRKQYINLPGSLHGINTTLKDNRYPAVRFVYRGEEGYKQAIQANIPGQVVNIRGR